MLNTKIKKIVFLLILISTLAPQGLSSDDNKRSKLATFLLSFFLGGFGADWFYLSRGVFSYIMVGIVKLLLIKFKCCCCSISFTSGEGYEISCCDSCCCGRLVSFGIFIWWVVDWIRILTDNFPDGNGTEL